MSKCEKSYIGKYVCYDAIDGGACWGRIKAEAKINTMDGEKEAFILEGRVVAHAKATHGMTVKFMPPGGDMASKSLAYDPETKQFSDDIELVITRVRGDTLLRKDVINLERDIIDVDPNDILSGVPDDLIFMSLLKGRAEGTLANKAIQLGLANMLGITDVRASLKEELLRRIARRSEGNDGASGTEANTGTGNH